MDLIIDANILFSALIKKSGTSEILFKHTLYAPKFIFVEFQKYEDELKNKTHRSKEEFNELFQIFERTIILIPEEEIEPFLIKAGKISPDSKDVLYVALALKLNCAIWSNDRQLKEKQNEVRVFSTMELINLFG